MAEKDQELSQRALAAAPCPLWVADAEGRICFANEALEELLGKSTLEMSGRSVGELIPRLVQGSRRGILAKALASPHPIQVRDAGLTVSRADQRDIPVEVHLARTEIGGQPHVVGQVVAVGESQRQVAQLREALKVAEQASRSKSLFLENMSHEIRIPLNTVIGLTEATLHTELAEAQRDHLRTILGSGEELLSALDFLDFVKMESEELELERIEFDLGEVVRDTLDSLAIRAEDRALSVTSSIAAQIPARLLGDPVRLRQVLANLVGNAIKFTERGEVELRVELEEQDEDSWLLQVSVRDTGVGIEPEIQDRMFEPFEQRALARSEGSGLGLSICQLLIERMDGQIGVESTPGEGSTFHFTARFGDVAHEQGKSAVPVGSDDPQVAPQRILLVEDSVANQKVAEAILGPHGHELSIAQNGREAVDMLASGEYDVVLMDLQMPVMDGLEATAAIRAAEGAKGGGQRVPIIAMTGHVLQGDRERCLAAGMDDYVPKPIRRRELFGALARAVASA